MEKEVEGGSRSVGSDIQRLPEECVSHAISLTSPRDACRFEAISAAFRSAAVSDVVWKRFLPSDYANIIARAVDRVEFTSMKDLYFRLCDPILIDGGRMGFCVDRETGAKCFIVPARELRIAWGDTPEHWRWIHDPESRFPEVAELLKASWLDIHGKINSRMLSKRTNYSVYLIYKLLNSARCLDRPFQEASVNIGTHVSMFSVRLMEDAEEPKHYHCPNRHEHTQAERTMVVKPNARQDGWMEILLGEFYNEEGDDGEVSMLLTEHKCQYWKNGLIVEGIEIRPKK